MVGVRAQEHAPSRSGGLGNSPNDRASRARLPHRRIASLSAQPLSAAGFVSALVSVLTLTFFILLGSERLINGAVRLFPEPRRPLVRGILSQSGGAVFGYISGNL